MKKQTAVLVWAAALLLVIAGCFGIYFVWDAGQSDVAGNTPVQVFSCLSTEIEEYTVERKDSRYTLEEDDGRWVIEDNERAKIDQKGIEAIMAAASNITATGTITRKDLESFDQSDQRRVKIDTDNGHDAVIRFLGTKDNLCAFRIDGDRQTYVMYQSSMEILAPKLDSIRVTDIFADITNDDIAPEYFYYKNYEGEVVEVRLKTSGEFANGKNNRYIMERPYRAAVDDDLFEQSITVKIPNIKAGSFVEKPDADLSVYGLDSSSAAELWFRYNGKSYVLYLGKAEGGMVYAKKDNAREIFTISASRLDFLDTDPFYILERGILSTDIDKILSVTVKWNKEKHIISVTRPGGDAENRYLIDGKVASREVFEEIAGEIAEIEYVGRADEDAENTRDIVINVSYIGGIPSQELSLAKSKHNDKNYVLFVGGRAEYTVESDDVHEVIEEIQKAINSPVKPRGV